MVVAGFSLWVFLRSCAGAGAGASAGFDSFVGFRARFPVKTALTGNPMLSRGVLPRQGNFGGFSRSFRS